MYRERQVDVAQASLWRVARDGPGVPQAAPLTKSMYENELALIRSELERFKPANVLDIRTDRKFEPLAYWKRLHENGFQRVSHLARIVLSVPGSSAPSERVFSLANLILTQLRANLLDFKVEQLTMLRHHLAAVGGLAFVEYAAAEVARVEDESEKARKRKSTAPSSQSTARARPHEQQPGDSQ